MKIEMAFAFVEDDRGCDQMVGHGFRKRGTCMNRAVVLIDDWTLCGEHGPQRIRETTKAMKDFMARAQENWNAKQGAK